MSVQYNGNSIVIPSNNQNKNLIVYSHPGDNIKFDFDISALNKKIVNGDLVIYLLNGCTITVVNFGLMALDNKAPSLSDIATNYNPFSLFDSSYYYDQDGLTPYVISRQISSPDNDSLPPGKKLTSSQDVFDDNWSSSKNNGEEQEAEVVQTTEVAPAIKEYVLKTLYAGLKKNDDIIINYISNNKHNYNEPSYDIHLIKLLLIDPKVIPYYGGGYTIAPGMHPGYNDLILSLGGGKLAGNEFAHYMYEAETINLAGEIEKVWFDGYTQSKVITRWINIGLPTDSVAMDKITLSGLPAGVKVANNLDPNLDIKQFGNTFEITVKGSPAGGVDIPLQYVVGLGGDYGITSMLNIRYEGSHLKTGDMVRGSISSWVEFKPVRSAEDISNYYKANSFTFSTLRDPLKIIFTNKDDVIKGGVGDYIYYGNAGNNKAYGGEAKEEFHLGVGTNSFYVGFGNTTVDVDTPGNKNTIYLSDALDKIKESDKNSAYTSITNGVIIFNGKYNGKAFLTKAIDFSCMYFDIGDSGEEVTKDDTLEIVSTKNLKTSINAYLGKGNNIVNGANSSMIIEVNENTFNEHAVLIRTDNTLTGVYIHWSAESNSYIRGSLKNDKIIGSESMVSIKFDGTNRGENEADYSKITKTLTYDASDGSVIKEGSNPDTIKGIKYFLGGIGSNVFYGNTYYTVQFGDKIEKYQADIHYSAASSLVNQNSLSYIKLEKLDNNGVTVDLESGVIVKHGTKGIDKFDVLKIGNIQSSNNDDKFYMTTESVSKTLDGMGGFNTIDYSRLTQNIVFSIYLNQPGTVEKGDNGNAGIDTIVNFRHFVGSRSGSKFALGDTLSDDDSFLKGGKNNDKEFRFILEGCADALTSNQVSYAIINNRSMVLDLNPENSTITIYKGNKPDGEVLFKDKVVNISNFFLGSKADHIIYAYSIDVLSYNIDTGREGKNTLSFEKSKSNIILNLGERPFNNITNIENLILSNNNDEVKMGSYYFFNTIDGAGGVNKVDFSNIGGNMKFDINLLDIKFEVEVSAGKKILFKNFQQIISSLGNDYYNIIFDLKDIDKLKNKNILFNANIGNNTINFENITNSTNPKNGIHIDLSGVDCVVKDLKGSHVLNFQNFTNVIGTKGNDVFVLPRSQFIYNIDGNGGDENAVSYEAYNDGVYIDKHIFNKFKNIQKIIGSKGNDFIELDKDSSLNVDGHEGFNTLIYNEKDTFESITVTITPVKYDYKPKEQSIITVDKGNGKVDKLAGIGVINFQNNNIKNGVQFFVNNIDNSTLNTNDHKVYLSGTSLEQAENKITYKKDLKNIVLNLDVESTHGRDGVWYSVVKNNDSIDYLKNFNNINLSTGSKVNIFNSVVILKNTNIIVNAQEDSCLSFEFYLGSFTVDVIKLNFKFSNNLSIEFKGFNKFYASQLYNTKFKFLSSADDSYTFDGKLSDATLSYENVSEDIVIDVSKNASVGDDIFNTVTIKKAKTLDKASNISTFIGGSGVTSIIVSHSFGKNMTFVGSASKKNENSIDYSSVSNSTKMVFSINQTGVVVSRDFGQYIDTLENINKIISGKEDTTFYINKSAVNANSIYYLEGNASAINVINFSTIDVDMSYHIDNEGKMSIQINNNNFGIIKNIHNFIAGSKINNFKLGNFFEGKYAESGYMKLFGNNQFDQDVLDLTETDKGLILDPLTGKISEGTENANLIIMTMSGITKILLGDGNHQLDISNKTSSVGWKEIVGGKGFNSVSFNRLGAAINYNLAEGVEGLSFTLINFKGVTGTKSNDTFYLNKDKFNIPAIIINGNGGLYNTLDYSQLESGPMIVDLDKKTVKRGSITDIVENINIFKSGSGGAVFNTSLQGSYQFIASDAMTDKNENILTYEALNVDLVFSFNNCAVIKKDGFYDKFLNITKFIGGSGENNIFLFSLASFSKNINKVIIDGGKGKNNVVNLSMLEKGMVYDIAKGSFTVDNKGNKLEIRLSNINSFIGSSYSDTFIFSNSINGVLINGGAVVSGVYNIANFAQVDDSITVDFAQKIVTYGQNKNYFINITGIIGSKKGGDVFKGLDSYTQYYITGGGSEGANNTIGYDGCFNAIILSIKDNKILIDKGGIQDVLININSLVLSKLSDIVNINDKNDFELLKKFKIIDGGEGNNTVNINFSFSSQLVLDLTKGSIECDSKTYTISFKNFSSWSFGKESFDTSKMYKIIAPRQLEVIRNITFFGAPTTFNTVFDCSNVEGNFFITAVNNSPTRGQLNITVGGSPANIMLQNVKQLILPPGRHLVDLGSIIYSGEDGMGRYVYKLVSINPSETQITHYITSIISEVGSIFITADKIQFSEVGTSLDINISADNSVIDIKTINALHGSLVIYFDKSFAKERLVKINVNDIFIKNGEILLKQDSELQNQVGAGFSLTTDNQAELGIGESTVYLNCYSNSKHNPLYFVIDKKSNLPKCNVFIGTYKPLVQGFIVKNNVDIPIKYEIWNNIKVKFDFTKYDEFFRIFGGDNLVDGDSFFKVLYQSYKLDLSQTKLYNMSITVKDGFFNLTSLIPITSYDSNPIVAYKFRAIYASSTHGCLGFHFKDIDDLSTAEGPKHITVNIGLDKSTNNNIVNVINTTSKKQIAYIDFREILSLQRLDLKFESLKEPFKNDTQVDLNIILTLETIGKIRNIILPGDVNKDNKISFNLTYNIPSKNKPAELPANSNVTWYLRNGSDGGVPQGDINIRNELQNMNIYNMVPFNNMSISLVDPKLLHPHNLFSNLYFNSAPGHNVALSDYFSFGVTNIYMLSKNYYKQAIPLDGWMDTIFNASGVDLGKSPVNVTLDSGSPGDPKIEFFGQGGAQSPSAVLNLFTCNSIYVQRINLDNPVIVKILDINTYVNNMLKYVPQIMSNKLHLFDFGSATKMINPIEKYKIFAWDDNFIPDAMKYKGSLKDISNMYTNALYLLKGGMIFDHGYTQRAPKEHTFKLENGVLNFGLWLSGSAYLPKLTSGEVTVRGPNYVKVDLTFPYYDAGRTYPYALEGILNEKYPFVIDFNKHSSNSSDTKKIDITMRVDNLFISTSAPANSIVTFHVLKGINRAENYNQTIMITNGISPISNTKSQSDFQYYGSILLGQRASMYKLWSENTTKRDIVIKSPEFIWLKDRTYDEKDYKPVLGSLCNIARIFSFEGVDTGITKDDVYSIVLYHTHTKYEENTGFYVLRDDVAKDVRSNIKVKEFNTRFLDVEKVIITGYKGLKAQELDSNKKGPVLYSVIDFSQFKIDYDARCVTYEVLFERALGSTSNELVSLKYFTEDKEDKIIRDINILFGDKSIVCGVLEKNSTTDPYKIASCMIMRNMCLDKIDISVPNKIKVNLFLEEYIKISKDSLASNHININVSQGASYFNDLEVMEIKVPSFFLGYTYKIDLKSKREASIELFLQQETGGDSLLKIDINMETPNLKENLDHSLIVIDKSRSNSIYYDQDKNNILNELRYKTSDSYEAKKGLDQSYNRNNISKEDAAWESKDVYLNSLNKENPKEEYWDLIDKYIKEAFKANAASETYYTVNQELVSKQQDEDTENKLFEKEESLNLDESYFINEDANNNHASIFRSIYDEENNISEQEYLQEDNYDFVNHNYQSSSSLENETGKTSDQEVNPLKPIENLNLSNLFDEVNTISENIDNTALVEDFGLNNITLEDLNHTYQLDEANSMAYTIDGCNNALNNYDNDYTIDTTPENQKNKTNQ